MTRKDYVAMANLIRAEVMDIDGVPNTGPLGSARRACAMRIAMGFVDIARKDNPNFSPDTFLRACGLRP